MPITPSKRFLEQNSPEIGSYSGVSPWLVGVPSFLPASAPAWSAGFPLVSDDTPPKLKQELVIFGVKEFVTFGGSGGKFQKGVCYK